MGNSKIVSKEPQTQFHSDFNSQAIFMFQDTISKQLNLQKGFLSSIGIFTFENLKKQPQMRNGVLISHDLVLTAAHNLFDHINPQEYFEEKTIQPQKEVEKFELDKNKYRFHLKSLEGEDKIYQILDWKFHEDFMKFSRVEFNFALVKLKTKVYNAQIFQISRFCEDCFTNKAIKLICSKADSIGEELHLNNYKIFEKISKQNRIDWQLGKIKYQISLEREEGGCPIIVDNKIIGIHCGGSLYEKINVGILLQQKIIQKLNYWRQIMESNYFYYNLCQDHVIVELKQQVFYVNTIKQMSILKKAYSNKIIELNLKQSLDQQTWKYVINIKMPRLSILNLNNIQIGETACKYLIKTPWKNINSLNLGYNKIGYIECFILAKSNWKQLITLKLHNNQISVRGSLYLSQSKWKNLMRLSLTKNKIGDAGCKYLSKSNWKKLIQLGLEDNSIGESGCLHLSKAEWRKISTLSLGNNYIGDVGCLNLTLADWKNLRACYLWQNMITNSGLLKLIMGYCKQIKYMNICMNPNSFEQNKRIFLIKKISKNYPAFR